MQQVSKNVLFTPSLTYSYSGTWTTMSVGLNNYWIPRHTQHINITDLMIRRYILEDIGMEWDLRHCFSTLLLELRHCFSRPMLSYKNSFKSYQNKATYFCKSKKLSINVCCRENLLIDFYSSQNKILRKTKIICILIELGRVR